MPTLIDLSGRKYGRLLVVRRASNNEMDGMGKTRVHWVCQCDCGNVCIVSGNDLRTGKTQSCGCVRKERASETNTTHGMSRTPLYSCWQCMKSRCYAENTTRYERYGGRGIKVCDEWKNDFDTFMKWAMANGYCEGLSIDRIDVDGNYCPENCRWATDIEQANNTSRNHFITHNGETHTIAEWARMYNIQPRLLFDRIAWGWDFETALTKPKQTCNAN